MHRTVTALVAVLFLASAVAAAFLGGEALYIGVLADPDTVAEYHLGAESMISHGGWAYQSRTHYLVHGIAFTVPFLVASVVLGRLLADRVRGSAA